ncbi:MAG TPA: hypothetical protein VLV15_10885, partial [Dongiaceae bacterium]|nr:hypothetical protein [Dongiaceae bacterium]
MALTWFSLIRSRLARSPALAWLVAAVLPLGQAHCVLMGVQVASDRACASAQPAAVVHACCAVRTVPAPAHPATRPADPFAPRCCACLGIPPATTIA